MTTRTLTEKNTGRQVDLMVAINCAAMALEMSGQKRVAGNVRKAISTFSRIADKSDADLDMIEKIVRSIAPNVYA